MQCRMLGENGIQITPFVKIRQGCQVLDMKKTNDKLCQRFGDQWVPQTLDDRREVLFPRIRPSVASRER